MKEETLKLLESLKNNWRKARDIQNRDVLKRNYGSEFTTVNGIFSWDIKNLVLLCDFVEGGGYEEYGSIVGLSEDGRLFWEYSSHCSCNEFVDSDAATSELSEGQLTDTKKSFELSSLPEDWETKIAESAKKLLEAL